MTYMQIPINTFIYTQFVHKVIARAYLSWQDSIFCCAVIYVAACENSFHNNCKKDIQH